MWWSHLEPRPDLWKIDLSNLNPYCIDGCFYIVHSSCFGKCCSWLYAMGLYTHQKDARTAARSLSDRCALVRIKKAGSHFTINQGSVAGGQVSSFYIYLLFKATRRCGLLRGPSSSSCRGLRPRPFFALRAKKDLFMSVLANILEFLVISSNLSKF